MSATKQEYEIFRERGGVIDLEDRIKLLFTGNDRVRYINGQVTANVAAAKSPSVLPACVTTAKGKLSAEIRVSVGPTGVLIDADQGVADTLLPRMERYIIADDVAMEDLTQRIAIVHLLGMKLEAVPESVRGKLVPSNRYGVPGWDWFPPFREDMHPGWEQLTQCFPVLSSDVVELIRIEQGVPRWGCELTTDTLPAEAGLDRTHIDFHKGCYIGQEVISRIKSVGHVNREMRGFSCEPGAPVAAGARIFSADAPDKDLGHLTSVTHSFALDRRIALGYLRRAAPLDGLFAASVENPDTPVRLTVHPRPFLS